MIFKSGRNNLALTIFVPFNCSNNCKFCTSKAGYRTNPPNIQNVKLTIKEFFEDYNFPITDVVFTGGEPMSDVRMLKKLIDMIPNDKNVYLNTTFVQRGAYDFITLVNSEPKIKGISISRHEETYKADCLLLNNICLDEFVRLFTKPVRINCVVKNQNIENLITRWQPYDVTLSLRRDFTTVHTEKELHNPYDRTAMYLAARGKWEENTRCNVCDTTKFRVEGMTVQYHKGLEHTAILHDNVMEINDLIIFQDGRFAYDWSDCDEKIVKALKSQYKVIKYVAVTPSNYHSLFDYYSGCGITINGSCGSNRSFCGGGGCG